MRSPLTTLCYVEKDDSYLMLHRVSKKHDVNKDKWIGIGGHFEEGERGDGRDGTSAYLIPVPCNCDIYCRWMAAGIYVSVYGRWI